MLKSQSLHLRLDQIRLHRRVFNLESCGVGNLLKEEVAQIAPTHPMRIGAELL
jgi:hypothetical protein